MATEHSLESSLHPEEVCELEANPQMGPGRGWTQGLAGSTGELLAPVLPGPATPFPVLSSGHDMTLPSHLPTSASPSS